MITCPYCGKQFKDLVSHFTQKHNISLEEFKNQYPDMPYRDIEYEKKRLSSVNKVCKSEEFKNKMSNIRKTVYIETDVHKLKMKEVNSNSDKRLKCSLSNKKYWEKLDEAEKLERSKKLSKINKKFFELNPELVKKRLQKGWLKNSYKNLITNHDQLNKIYFRSNQEKEFANSLLDSNIWFYYEGTRKMYDNNNRLYKPDFYIPEYDINVECKTHERHISELDIIKWKSLDNLYIVIGFEDIHIFINSLLNEKSILTFKSDNYLDKDIV